MALTIGTNVGFVTSAPAGDPTGGSTITIDGVSAVCKFTTSANAKRITEMGWWCNTASQAANFQLGLYAADGASGEAGTRLQTSGDIAKGTGGAAWKKATGLSWSVTPNTVYWLGVQLDNVTTTTTIDIETSGGAGYDTRTSQTALINPYGGGALADADGIVAIYALIELNTPPTVALVSPANASTQNHSSATFRFTGTDADADDVLYNIQVDPYSDFTGNLSAFSIYGLQYYNTYYNAYSGSANAYLGHCFLTPNNGLPCTVLSLNLILGKYQSPTGSGYCAIYASTGSYGTTMKPTGSALCVSDAYDVATLPTSPANKTLTFSGANRVALANNTYYVAVFYFTGGNSTNYVKVGIDNPLNASSGNRAYSSDGATWTAGTDYGVPFSGVYSFGAYYDRFSETDAGFPLGHPNTSGVECRHIMQWPLSSQTWYWRVRAKDPSGTNTWGAWSSSRSLIVSVDAYNKRRGFLASF